MSDSKIQFDEKTRIGKNSAETDDEFLINCFIQHPSYGIISDLDQPKMLLAGSTGTGKTALLKHIEHIQKNSRTIELSEMAMNYIANSDALSFLRSIGVDLNPFYNLMWKHTICLEFIRLRFGVKDERGSIEAFQKIKDFFSGNDRKKALKYLADWSDKFWIEMDENVIELTKTAEENVKAELGADFEKFKSNAGYARQLSDERKLLLQRRARNFINPRMLSELSDVISCLKEYREGYDAIYYLMIDGLDENWVDSSIKYELIQNLIETLKNLRRIMSLKIIISIRFDIIEKISRENPSGVFQSEKYDDYIQKIIWTKDELKSLVNKRIGYLFNHKYSSNTVSFEEIFTSKVRKQDPFEYIVERTLNRPRDIIIFVNLCLERAKGSVAVNESSIISAEEVYSSNRRSALVDEWISAFPTIDALLSIIDNRKESFEFSELIESNSFEELALKICEKDSYKTDSIYELIEMATDSDSNLKLEDILREVSERLYLCGAIGLKIEKTSSWQWFHKTHNFISKGSITEKTKMKIHPMLHIACKTKLSPR